MSYIDVACVSINACHVLLILITLTDGLNLYEAKNR